MLFLSLLVVGLTFGQGRRNKKTVALESLKNKITAEIFQTDFPASDCNYHSITAASDGKIYFSLSTHNEDYACRFYSFDPKSKKIKLLGKLDEVVGEDSAKQISQGKIHTRLFEHDGKLWFATHTSFYQNGLPGTDSGDKIPFKGGHFLNYDLKSGKFTDLAQIFPSEGIITMNMDKENLILYGLTWPAGLLVSYDVKADDLRYWGAIQAQGEWGHRPWDWDRVCRTLAIDPEGYVYGSTLDGAVWKYDREENRRVKFIEGLDLSKVPFSQSAEETMKGDFQNNWRAMEWNPNTESFWGVHFESTTLFEFKPAENYVRAVAELRPEEYLGLPRNPEVTQLGFMIGPNNTIYYLAHGPAVVIEGRSRVQSAVYLITYDIDNDVMTNHGPVLSEDLRRVFFTESIAIGPDDHIYSVAWVETTDPARIKTVRAERRSAPAETERAVYEMQLIRLPRWQEFSK
jgi:hypothetical protein